MIAPTVPAHPAWCARNDYTEHGEHRSRSMSATSCNEDPSIRLALAQVTHPAARPHLIIGIDGQVFNLSIDQTRTLGWLLRRIIAKVNEGQSTPVRRKSRLGQHRVWRPPAPARSLEHERDSGTNFAGVPLRRAAGAPWRYNLVVVTCWRYSRGVSSWQISLTEEVDRWYLELCETDPDSAEQIAAAIDTLAEEGPTLGRPLVDHIKGSKHKNMKELRPGSAGGSEVRILFAFDPEREAILLVAGDKAGNWKEWYKQNIPIADYRFDRHLQELKGQC